jgi:hypothetical protein
MANGFTSEQMQVTRGIRQGCPLAPLLFIIAVDLLYDAIEADEEMEGIDIGPAGIVKQLKVAGYADDTAIYIAKRRMQAAAIRTVKAFSAVSGLKLNVKKSAAINLAHGGAGGAQAAVVSMAGEAENEGGQVAEIESVRYLGHIAGAGDTTTEAWTKAMEALRVRLTLAETKTTLRSKERQSQGPSLCRNCCTWQDTLGRQRYWPRMRIGRSETMCGVLSFGYLTRLQQGGSRSN